MEILIILIFLSFLNLWLWFWPILRFEFWDDFDMWFSEIMTQIIYGIYRWDLFKVKCYLLSMLIWSLLRGKEYLWVLRWLWLFWCELKLLEFDFILSADPKLFIAVFQKFWHLLHILILRIRNIIWNSLKTYPWCHWSQFLLNSLILYWL